MMDQFVVWTLRGVTVLCLRNEANWFWLEPIKRLPEGINRE